MMQYLLYTLFSSILFVTSAFAAGSISSVDAISVDGQSTTITGSSFGTNAAIGTSAFQWTGDNIEAATVGAYFQGLSGWGVYVTEEDSESAVPRYTNTDSHSGSKCVKIDWTPESVYKGHLYWDYGSSITRVYITWWIKTTDYSDDGSAQYKVWRIKNNTSFVDGCLDFLQNVMTGPSQRIAQLVTTPGSSYWWCDGCAYQTNEHYLESYEIIGPNSVMDRWCRLEYWIDVGTEGNNDGTFFYKFHDPDNPTPIIRDIPKLSYDGNLRIINSGSSYTWQSVQFGGISVDGMNLIAWIDDMTIQVGSWARVELGNASTWSACTHREIQKPTSWSATEIEFDAFYGSFASNDEVYLYVVDGDGDVSPGYGPITLGGSVPVSNVSGNIFNGINLK